MITTDNVRTNTAKGPKAFQERGRTFRFLKSARMLPAQEIECGVQRDTSRILRLFRHIRNDAARGEIRNQIELAVRYISKNKQALMNQAVRSGGNLYLRPQDYLGSLGGKIPVPHDSPPWKAKYIGAHIMITRRLSGATDFDLIPKHPDLWLGSGTYKYVRMAIRIENAAGRFKLKACASAGGRASDAPDGHLKIKREAALINHIHATSGLETCQCLFFERVRHGDMVTKAKMILPFANRGDLHHYFFEGGFKRDVETLGENKIAALKLDVMIACAEALKQQHASKLVNGDLKLENTLIHIERLGRKDQKMTCTMPDLGFAYFTSDSISCRNAGTYLYQGPELCDLSTEGFNAVVDGQSQDIFALGIIFHQLIHATGDVPNYAKASFSEKKQRHEWLNYAMSWAKEPALNDFDQLIQMMMHPDPSKRPAAELVKGALYRLRKGKADASWDATLRNDKRGIRDSMSLIQDMRNRHREYTYFSGNLPESMPPKTFVLGICHVNHEPVFVFKDDSGHTKTSLLNHIFITNREGAVASLRLTTSSQDLFVRFVTDTQCFAAYRILEDGVQELALTPAPQTALMDMLNGYHSARHLYESSFDNIYNTASRNFDMALRRKQQALCEMIRRNYIFDIETLLRRAHEFGLCEDDLKRAEGVAAKRAWEFEKALVRLRREVPSAKLS